MTGSSPDPGLRRLEASPRVFPARLAEMGTLITMALLFFAVVTPIGLVMRLAGRDPLRLRFEPAEPSYWVPRASQRRRSMARPF
jgi:hypothetical protein